MALSRRSGRPSSVASSTRASSNASVSPAPSHPQPLSQSRLSTRPSSSHSRSKTKYATLAPHNVNISRSKILKKWKPLPPFTQDRIRSVLLDVKNESKARRRKAVPRVRKNGAVQKDMLSEEEWEGVVDGVVERLIHRLPRMPFPPSSTRSTSSQTASTQSSTSNATLDFSLEPLLTRSSHLRATLSSQQQSCKLLQAQIKRETNALKRDKTTLKGLNEGVRRSKELAGRQARSLHHLVARTLDDDINIADRREDGNDHESMMDALIPTTATRSRTNSASRGVALTQSAISDDTDLAPLVKQLRSHLNSMQANVSGLKTVRTALAQGEMAVMRLNSRVRR